jgi:alpha-1,2-glucosyltransferase
MLYIWPFITFFSAPLIAPIGVSFLQNLVSLLSIPLFPRLTRKYLLVSIYIFLALVTTLIIIKYNTIIHPFTLADNRHYMFYVFRYTILRHPLIRYLLAPVYLGCAYLVYLTLNGSSELHSHPTLKEKKSKEESEKKLIELNTNETESEGPTTSFLIILLATTALSLITAPLVEPRYFILPWVIWRLNVPPLPTQPNLHWRQKGKTSPNPGEKILEFVRYWAWEGHDYRLWLETAWFLLINVVTGYIFLHRGFEWPQEAGKVQRFMW